jgi:hypothetical protein
MDEPVAPLPSGAIGIYVSFRIWPRVDSADIYFRVPRCRIEHRPR